MDLSKILLGFGFLVIMVTTITTVTAETSTITSQAINSCDSIAGCIECICNRPATGCGCN
ncbi:hypothetical protein [Methanosalsum natronophilum]|uniref:hypothetical protein n=1 Tax=Methanosalsum natronophilum TaxID=768733 RepID=UPI00216941F4|nr:hypothetical protein [Methanosalsum natronophilum]MCS3924142.1 hypothetical protein [Methanosalsum natronophilum]